MNISAAIRDIAVEILFRPRVPAGQIPHRHAQGTADWVAVYVCETETVVADVLLDMFVCVTVCLVEKHVFL